jgi:hypothetical protein
VLPPAQPAAADSRLTIPANATWTSECGACHLAYPPQLLPARAWRQIMQSLDRHFGTDASLEPRAAEEVRIFLEQHAGRDRGGSAPARITETDWFRREHREVPAGLWAHPEVKNRANCAACHRAAERGDYGERTLRLPR